MRHVRPVVAELAGTAMFLAIVVGSGIMGERLAGGNDAVALLGNTIATGAGLVVLITMFGPVSGAHFNPVVTFDGFAPSDRPESGGSIHRSAIYRSGCGRLDCPPNVRPGYLSNINQAARRPGARLFGVDRRIWIARHYIRHPKNAA